MFQILLLFDNSLPLHYKKLNKLILQWWVIQCVPVIYNFFREIPLTWHYSTSIIN